MWKKRKRNLKEEVGSVKGSDQRPMAVTVGANESLAQPILCAHVCAGWFLHRVAMVLPTVFLTCYHFIFTNVIQILSVPPVYREIEGFKRYLVICSLSC